MSLIEFSNLPIDEISQINTSTGNAAGSETPEWNPLASYRSHVDVVRHVSFHPQHPLLLSLSDDGTAKFWNCQNSIAAMKNGRMDDVKSFEPIATIRGHRGPVLTSAFHPEFGLTFTGGLDGRIGVWKTPTPNAEPYAPFGRVSSQLLTWFSKHSDAIWGLATLKFNPFLIAVSADGFISSWNLNQTEHPCVANVSYTNDEGEVQIPTSLVVNEDGRVFVSFVSGELVEFNSETHQAVRSTKSASRITSLASDSSSRVLFTGLQDASIKFYDVRAGCWFHSMRAHSDAISSMTIDNSGIFVQLIISNLRQVVSISVTRFKRSYLGYSISKMCSRTFRASNASQEIRRRCNISCIASSFKSVSKWRCRFDCAVIFLMI